MKKIFILLVFGLLLLLAACGGKDNGSIVNNNDSSNVHEQNGSIADVKNNNETDKNAIAVDKGLFNVEITIPAIMITDDPEQLKAKAEQEDGVSKVIINSDGSLTYKMSRAAHKRIMGEMKENLEETIGEIVNSGDYPSIKNIKPNNSFTVFTMAVDREGFENSFDGIATLGLGMGSLFYQALNGANIETIKATIHIEDTKTGEVFSTVVYPDDLR